MREQPLHDCFEVLHGHQEHQRAAAAREGIPVVLTDVVTVDDGDRGAQATMA